MEEISQLHNQNLLLAERLLQLELQVSVMQVQLQEHVHRMTVGEAVLLNEQQLEDPLPEEPESYDGLD